MLIIREAKLEDLKVVHQLEEELFGQHSYPLFVLRQLFDITNDLFLIAEVSGAVAGYAIGHYNAEQEEGWLLSLAVHPVHRGKRIGEQLTATLAEALKAKGARTMLLTVHPENAPALRIYQQAGFTTTQLYPDYYLDNSPRWLMVKTL
ncbi:GNAT family N-acetyltransferase [Botryobacter ruber]|uniref:GNAT family N-acetyltransferase n=1 Tax=Botryobacter ruber TaxID=2171629 RepID=UPI000E0B343A|nr:GNAT family N-acetyltransferase [Botryobacter ruber]